jgi:hypothetical protein
MQIKTITYRRTKNLVNYMSVTVEVHAELNEGENPCNVFEELKEFVLDCIEIESDEES